MNLNLHPSERFISSITFPLYDIAGIVKKKKNHPKKPSKKPPKQTNKTKQ
jgi:hypothetical protein